MAVYPTLQALPLPPWAEPSWTLGNTACCGQPCCNPEQERGGMAPRANRLRTCITGSRTGLGCLCKQPGTAPATSIKLVSFPLLETAGLRGLTVSSGMPSWLSAVSLITPVCVELQALQLKRILLYWPLGILEQERVLQTKGPSGPWEMAKAGCRDTGKG